MTFEITRLDGRSNATVLLDYVKGHEPGRIYTFQELGEALGAGTDRLYDVPAIRNVVTHAFSRLLTEQQRILYNVRGVGYRLAHGSDHNRLALWRKRRSDVQMRRGLQTLQNVRWEELDENARKIHEGTLLVIGALYQQQRALDRRLSAVEDAVQRLKNGK